MEVTFLLSITFRPLHKFLYVVSLILSLTQWLFKNVLFNFRIFINFSLIFFKLGMQKGTN